MYVNNSQRFSKIRVEKWLFVRRTVMRTFFQRALTVFFILTVTVGLVTACKKADPTVLEGKWGYIHDPSVVILEAKGDRLTYEGKQYSFTVDGDHLVLKQGNEEVKLRFLISGDHTYIYRTTDYVLKSSPQADPLIGQWENEQNKWSFEFTEKGEFLEDGIFPGTYSVSDHGTFKLMYTDHFEDTECYYSITGQTLTVEYPWEIVKAEAVSQ